MIISASRRTDIPAFYSDWFFNRVREGFVLSRNPVNFRQVSKISLAPGAVDGIVFWTKNPSPMVDRLGALKEYMYYFQFTVTPYGADIEPNLPSKTGAVLPEFKRLAEAAGADRVVWRYDPILISGRYPEEYHLAAFEKIARALRGYTRRVTVSFIDVNYRGVKGNTDRLALSGFPREAKLRLCSALAETARGNGMEISACAEAPELRQCGVSPARCIDAELLEKLLGRPLKIPKDRRQRPGCNCAASVDIGMYNTCENGCLYCYANYSPSAVAGNRSRHDPLSPLVCGEVEEGDMVYERGGK